MCKYCFSSVVRHAGTSTDRERENSVVRIQAKGILLVESWSLCGKAGVSHSSAPGNTGDSDDNQGWVLVPEI